MHMHELHACPHPPHTCSRPYLLDRSHPTRNSKGWWHAQEGVNFAKEHGMLFIECSAKTKAGIIQAFEELVQKVMRLLGAGCWVLGARCWVQVCVKGAVQGIW